MAFVSGAAITTMMPHGFSTMWDWVQQKILFLHETKSFCLSQKQREDYFTRLLFYKTSRCVLKHCWSFFLLTWRPFFDARHALLRGLTS